MSFRKKNKKSLCGYNKPAGLKHLALIMDGNGRWAQNKGWPRYFGHFRGVKALRHTVKLCSKLKIPFLTVFAFSTENWKRSSLEVSVIVKLMRRTLSRYTKEFEEEGIRLRVLGDLAELGQPAQDIFHEVSESTKNNQGLQLIVAVNYGGRREILKALKQVAAQVKQGILKPCDIDEKTFSKYLSSASFPPPDLIVRTGAVHRLSNFYLWSSAYSEIYFSPLLWPDFNEEELKKALNFYAKSQRRFGSDKAQGKG